MALEFDVITDILSRLPVKSLLRFKSWSKTYCSLIETLNFIKLHLNQSIQTNTNLDLIIVDDNGSIYAANLDSDSKLLSPVEIDSPYKPQNVGLTGTRYIPHVIGSCHGLLAVHYGKDISLWNPSTKKYQILPEFLSNHGSSCILFGFGYDVISDDYKVMMLMKNGRVMIDSLKGDCSTDIDGIDYKISAYNSKCGVFVGGWLHWIVDRQRDNNDQLILAFDLRDNRFHEVPITNPKEYRSKIYSMVIGELGGCLSMSYTCKSYLEISIMKEYGIAESRTKLISLGTSMMRGSFFSFLKDSAGYSLIPLCYSKSGNKVLLSYNLPDGYLDCIFICEPKEKMIVGKIDVDAGDLTKVAANISVTSLVTPMLINV